MKKRAKICLYIFLVCAFCALGIIGNLIFNPNSENVMVGSRKFVTFNEVPYASSYSMSVKSLDGADLNDYVAKYKVQKEFISENQYSFKIEVLSNNNIKIAEETYKQKITSQNEDKIDCIILDYTVNFFNVNGQVIETRNYVDQELEEVDKNIVCCVISEYFEDVFNKDAKYTVTFLAYDENGDLIENSENQFEYNYYAYYERDFLRRENYFINGNWYDYVISNKNELKNLVWHTILYRNDDVTFYVKTSAINSSNINSIVVDAINSYPEYDALNDSGYYASIEDNIGKLENFTYYLEENFTKTYDDLKDLDKNAYNSSLKKLHKKDDSYKLDYIKDEVNSNRNFAIDNNNVEEVEVNNT